MDRKDEKSAFQIDGKWHELIFTQIEVNPNEKRSVFPLFLIKKEKYRREGLPGGAPPMVFFFLLECSACGCFSPSGVFLTFWVKCVLLSLMLVVGVLCEIFGDFCKEFGM